MVASGGHPLPVILRADGSTETVGAPGTLIGSFAEVELHDASAFLRPGDAVVFFTDGVTEARHDDQFFGEERLKEILASCAGADAETVADRVLRAVLSFQDGLSADDIAVLVLRVAPLDGATVS